MTDNDTSTNEPSEIVISLYQNRFKQMRLGQECYKKGDAAKAIEYYSNYLHILAQYFGTEEKNLRPEMFDRKKDIGEILLISNIYWNLAKTYDKNLKFQHQSTRCLEQFLRFTKGYKHQYANTRLLKNYINSGRPRNQKEFKRIYETIKTQATPCFVSTYCFGHDAPVTNQLRLLKKDISGNFLGDVFIKTYYQLAPGIVNYFERHVILKKTALPLIKKILFLIAKAHQTSTRKNNYSYPYQLEGKTTAANLDVGAGMPRATGTPKVRAVNRKK